MMSGNNPRLENALFEAIAKLGADAGTIHLKAADADELHLAASHEIPHHLLERVQVIPWGKGLAGAAAARAQPIHFCNLQIATSPDIHDDARAAGMRGAIVVPMLSGDDVVGTIGVATRSERTFTQREIGWLLHFGRRIAGEGGGHRMAA
jgi:signal transduction protein with GAF and PtsI domain